jgi:hypothetical protein
MLRISPVITGVMLRLPRRFVTRDFIRFISGMVASYESVSEFNKNSSLETAESMR